MAKRVPVTVVAGAGVKGLTLRDVLTISNVEMWSQSGVL